MATEPRRAEQTLFATPAALAGADDGTERRLPVSDAVVLAEYRAGNSQRALALRYKVSKGAIQKAIAREEAREAELIPA